MLVYKETFDMSMVFHRNLPIPQEIKEKYSLSYDATVQKQRRDIEIAQVFSGESDKFLLIIGPCSADYEDSVMDYVNRLAKLQDEVKDKIIIIPRIYTNKPRTTGDGYKGMIHQPDPNGKPDMLAGLLAIRSLHARVITETGLTCADEMLYPENYQYLSDLLSYVAIGARSVEDQQHRLTASGIDVPVGMKNPSCGDLSVMLNSIMAAQHSHTFIYRGWEVTTSGNTLAHAVLRGSIDNDGKCIPNYHHEDLIKLFDAYAKKGLQNISCIVDTNHYNSNKQYLEQVRIAKEVLHSRRHSDDVKHMIKGLMIESYLEDGNQKIGDCCYGKSITDPCLGWEKSERLVKDIADLL